MLHCSTPFLLNWSFIPLKWSFCPLNGCCWRLLMSIINRQHILHIYLIPSPNIGIGFLTNEFHTFWWICECRTIYPENNPEITVIHSKRANRRQQVIQLVKTAKGNSIRSQGPTAKGGGPTAMKVGRPAQPLDRPAHSGARSVSAASYAFLRSTPLILRRF